MQAHAAALEFRFGSRRTRVFSRREEHVTWGCPGCVRGDLVPTGQDCSGGRVRRAHFGRSAP